MADDESKLLESFKEGVCIDCALLSIVVLGASGDLAKKKIYPVLWSLYKHDLIDRKNTKFIGYARSKLSHDDLVGRIKPFLKASGEEEEKLLAEFLDRQEYVAGQYDQQVGMCIPCN